jgi:hypothetical protein
MILAFLLMWFLTALVFVLALGWVSSSKRPSPGCDLNTIQQRRKRRSERQRDPTKAGVWLMPF